MRGCLTLIIGFLAGVGLMLYWWPRIPGGTALPAKSDVRVRIADSYLAAALQQRFAGQSFPRVTGVRVTSSPPAALVVRGTLTAGPLSTPAAIEVRPVAAGGNVQVQIISSQLAGIPVPPALTGFLAGTINSNLTHLLGSSSRITGVQVVPSGLVIAANYG